MSERKASKFNNVFLTILALLGSGVSLTIFTGCGSQSIEPAANIATPTPTPSPGEEALIAPIIGVGPVDGLPTPRPTKTVEERDSARYEKFKDSYRVQECLKNGTHLYCNMCALKENVYCLPHLGVRPLHDKIEDRYYMQMTVPQMLGDLVKNGIPAEGAVIRLSYSELLANEEAILSLADLGLELVVEFDLSTVIGYLIDDASLSQEQAEMAIDGWIAQMTAEGRLQEVYDLFAEIDQSGSFLHKPYYNPDGTIVYPTMGGVFPSSSLGQNASGVIGISQYSPALLPIKNSMGGGIGIVLVPAGGLSSFGLLVPNNFQ